MTSLLNQAIAIARELPQEEQDALARTILALTQSGVEFPLDEETRAAILEGFAQVERGEAVPDEEIEALWKRHGL